MTVKDPDPQKPFDALFILIGLFGAFLAFGLTISGMPAEPYRQRCDGPGTLLRCHAETALRYIGVLCLVLTAAQIAYEVVTRALRWWRRVRKNG